MCDVKPGLPETRRQQDVAAAGHVQYAVWIFWS